MRMMGDLISRDALRKAFHYRIKFFNKSDWNKAMLIIDSIPAVRKYERPHGKWIESDVPESVLVKCSVCGFNCGAYTFNYCPNCGADMREADND